MRDSELFINFCALAEITGVSKEDLAALDIQELEILWKRFFLLSERGSISSNSNMQQILDEEKYAEALAEHEIDNIGTIFNIHGLIFFRSLRLGISRSMRLNLFR